MRVLKYHLDMVERVGDVQVATITMPVGARVLHVHEQAGFPTLWAQCDPDAPTEHRRFAVIPTGFDEVPDGAVFIGTAHVVGNVWHVFELAG